MAIKIHGNYISGAQTGISVPKDADVDIDSNSITACRTAIEVRDEHSLRSVLGLSRTASTDEIVKLLRELDHSSSPEATAAAARSAGAEKMLAAGSNITTLVTGLWQLKESGLVRGAIAVLTGQV